MGKRTFYLFAVLLMTLTLRWKEGTLTNQEADRLRDEIVAACRVKHSAELRA